MEPTLAIIAPHPPVMVEAVGGARSAVTAASAAAMNRAAVALDRFAPGVLVLSSPHAPLARDGFLVRAAARLDGDLSDFGAGSAAWSASGDPEYAAAIIEECSRTDITAAPMEQVTSDPHIDHALLVPMWFLDRAGGTPVVEVSLSQLPAAAHQDFGRAIRTAASRLGRRVAFVASGDLSHRLTPDAPAGYAPRGAEFDRAVVDLVRRGDLGSLADLDLALVSQAGECGLRSFLILSGFLGDSGFESRVLHYEGPWGVGYLTAVLGDADSLAAVPDTPETGAKGGRPADEESLYVDLARRSIHEFVLRHRILEPPDDPALAEPSAAFVSLHRQDSLCGCIGTTEPTTPSLGHEIVAMAIQAATQDPRFSALQAPDLDDLEISVDILHPPERVSDASELDAQQYGVIVSRDWRRGLLLPALEGVDSPEQQIAIARRKAGIQPGESVTLERFRVDRHH